MKRRTSSQSFSLNLQRHFSWLQPVWWLDISHVPYGHTAALRANRPFVPQSVTQTGTRTKRERACTEGRVSLFTKQNRNYWQKSRFSKQKALHQTILQSRCCRDSWNGAVQPTEEACIIVRMNLFASVWYKSSRQDFYLTDKLRVRMRLWKTTAEYTRSINCLIHTWNDILGIYFFAPAVHVA